MADSVLDPSAPLETKTTIASPSVEKSAPGPTGVKDRIATLDIVRGVAILGILIMNIVGMGLHYSEFAGPSAKADTTLPDFIAWLTQATLFEGTFRTIFGMLFGAGIYLFMSNVEKRETKGRARTLHLKRTSLLMLFGLVDMFLLLWFGDILFLYGFIGLFLWLFRKSGYKTLTVWLVIFALISTLLKMDGGGDDGSSEDTRAALADLTARVEAGETLSDEEMGKLVGKQFAVMILDVFEPTDEDRLDQIAQVKTGWSGAFDVYVRLIIIFQFIFPFFFGLWDSLIAMILGIMLFKSGFLKGEAKTSTYLILMLVGYLVVLPFRTMAMLDYAGSGFDIQVSNGYQIYYDLFRVTIALAHISLICLLVRYGWMPLKNQLAATGRMALTNYLTQSVFALVVFILLGFYENFTRAELYLFVAAIWVFQILFSQWWLKNHAQGPMEALWRRMTYGKQAKTQKATG